MKVYEFVEEAYKKQNDTGAIRYDFGLRLALVAEQVATKPNYVEKS